MGIILFLAFMAFLYQFTAIPHWWLGFYLVMCFLGYLGVKITPLTLIGAAIVAKVLKDVLRK